MNLKSVLNLIEVRTLVAGLFPVLLGSVYSLYTYRKFNILFFIGLVIAMALVQSATNILNDLMDFYRGTDQGEKKEEKVLVREHIEKKQIIGLIAFFLFVAAIIGIFIASQTSYYILLVAVCGGIIAFFYSAGPLPISHTPFGELFSSVTMGIGIATTVAYIHSGIFQINMVWMALPTTIFIAYIMFTNNLCDREMDLKAKRHTLSGYLGFTCSKYIWLAASSILVGVTVLLVILKIYPVLSLLCVGILLDYKEILAMKDYAQKDFQKGPSMGMIAKIGLQYHVLLILAFLSSWVLEVFK